MPPSAQPLDGLRGVIVLRIAKDRPGSIRPNCGAWRKSDRTQEAPRIIVDSMVTGRTAITVEPPTNRVDSDDNERHGFRPTALMERVSRYLEGMIELVSGRAVSENVHGKAPMIRSALDVLVDESYVARTPGPRGAYMHTSVSSYRQASDPRSNAYLNGDALNPANRDLKPVTVTATASLFKTGDAGRSHSNSSHHHPPRRPKRPIHPPTRKRVDDEPIPPTSSNSHPQQS